MPCAFFLISSTTSLLFLLGVVIVAIVNRLVRFYISIWFSAFVSFYLYLDLHRSRECFVFSLFSHLCISLCWSVDFSVSCVYILFSFHLFYQSYFSLPLLPSLSFCRFIEMWKGNQLRTNLSFFRINATCSGFSRCNCLLCASEHCSVDVYGFCINCLLW